MTRLSNRCAEPEDGSYFQVRPPRGPVHNKTEHISAAVQGIKNAQFCINKTHAVLQSNEISLLETEETD